MLLYYLSIYVVSYIRAYMHMHTFCILCLMYTICIVHIFLIYQGSQKISLIILFHYSNVICSIIYIFFFPFLYHCLGFISNSDIYHINVNFLFKPSFFCGCWSNESSVCTPLCPGYDT